MAVDYINAVSGATGTFTGFQFSGSDSNVNVPYTTKGTGSHSFYNGLSVSTQPLFVISGSATIRVNYFTSTVVSLLPLLLFVRLVQILILAQILIVKARVLRFKVLDTNTAAAAGYVGEIVSSVIANASAVSFRNSVVKDITSIS